MANHNHHFRRMIKTLDIPKGKDWFHCERCDSTVEYSETLSEHEVNHLVANMARPFPCIAPDQK